MSGDSQHEALTLADETVDVERAREFGDRRERLLDRFVILDRLGSGGMGEVYAAYDEKLDRKIALKVLHRARRLSTRARARMLREARALARLSHPNVVTIFDVGVEDDDVFIAMELVDGCTLGDWLEQQPRSWGEVLEVFVAVGEGLAAAHELGLVHRDVKPHNVLIDGRGRPRLIDFGLVREHGGADESHAGTQDDEPSPGLAADAPLTRTGGLLGTPQYMSPEQFAQRGVTALSDQFGLCVMLYEALYGHPPFEGEQTHARAAFVLSGEVRRPAKSRGVPDELLAVILRGLRVDPFERWPDVSSLLLALRGLLDAYDPENEKPAAVRFRRRLLVMLVGVVMAVLGSFGAAAMAGEVVVDARSVLVLDASMLVLLGGAAGLLRRRWTINRQSRRLVGFILLLTVLYSVQDLTGALVGRPLVHTSLANAVCFTILCFFMAPLTSGALRWAGLWAAVWTVVMMLDAERFYVHFQIANVGGGMIAALLMPRRFVDRWIRAAASERGTSDSIAMRTTFARSSSTDTRSVVES